MAFIKNLKFYELLLLYPPLHFPKILKMPIPNGISWPVRLPKDNNTGKYPYVENAFLWIARNYQIMSEDVKLHYYGLWHKLLKWYHS